MDVGSVAGKRLPTLLPAQTQELWLMETDSSCSVLEELKKSKCVWSTSLRMSPKELTGAVSIGLERPTTLPCLCRDPPPPPAPPLLPFDFKVYVEIT